MSGEEIYKFILEQETDKYVLENEIFAIRNNDFHDLNYAIYVDGYISLDAIRQNIEKQNLIEKQQKEIEELRKQIRLPEGEEYIFGESAILDELEKKDKIINEMANHIATTDSNLCEYLDMTTKCKYYAGENKKTCDNCIKEYFKKKVEEDFNEGDKV